VIVSAWRIVLYFDHSQGQKQRSAASQHGCPCLFISLLGVRVAFRDMIILLKNINLVHHAFKHTSTHSNGKLSLEQNKLL